MPDKKVPEEDEAVTLYPALSNNLPGWMPDARSATAPTYTILPSC